jgi:phosphate transport system substrate-binding protein
MRLKCLTVVLVFVCSCLYSGCKFDEIKSVATTGEISITIDESIVPVIDSAIREFERLNPDAHIEINSVPTKYAVAELVNGQTKFIILSRDFNEEEKEIIHEHNIEIEEYKYAVDGIGFIVSKDNPVERVTSEDLRKIFSGEYRNWTDIKVQDEEQNQKVRSFFTGAKNRINTFIPRRTSGVSEFLKDSILKDSDFYNNSTMCTTSVQMLEEVRNNVSSIGISNSAWLSTGNQEELDTTVNTLRVSRIRESGFQEDFVRFHQGLIYNGEYPYRRMIYIFTTQKGISLVTGLLTFFTRYDGQRIALKQGLVPVTQPVRTIQIN